jgi:hypothetical protein
MANEAELVFETELPIPFTCANGTGIEKGTLLKLVDPMSVQAATNTSDVVGGIAATEKIANDGKTSIAVYRRGIFKGFASGAIPIGAAIGSIATANFLRNNNNLTRNAHSGSRIWGISLEEAATGETFLFELNPMADTGA